MLAHLDYFFGISAVPRYIIVNHDSMLSISSLASDHDIDVVEPLLFYG